MRTFGFHHLAIFVRDLEQLARFYRDVLGLSEITRHLRDDGALRSIWLALPSGGFLALEARPDALAAPVAPTRGMAVLALGVAAAERTRIAEELRRCGIAIVKETRWTMYFDDPEGNHLALSHYPDPPPER
jgi:catechol 2,3-dioxygenase-like lactoylglutathione lyase family enzyme